MSNHAQNYNKPITLIGVGKLGLCFGLVLQQAGYKVLIKDNRQEVMNEIKSVYGDLFYFY